MTLLNPCRQDQESASDPAPIDGHFTQLRGLWARARQLSNDGLPRRSDLEVVHLGPFMANLALLEDGGEGLRFRLAGAGIERFYDHPLHKQGVSAQLLGAEAKTLTELVGQVWALNLPLLATAVYRTARGPVSIHRLLLPLAPSSVDGARLVMVAEYVRRPREPDRTHRPPVLDPATRQMFVTADPWEDRQRWVAPGRLVEERRADLVACPVVVAAPSLHQDLAQPPQAWMRCRVSPGLDG